MMNDVVCIIYYYYIIVIRLFLLQHTIMYGFIIPINVNMNDCMPKQTMNDFNLAILYHSSTLRTYSCSLTSIDPMR